MSPILVMNPKRQLQPMIDQNGTTLLTDILSRLKYLLENNRLDDNIKLIGIANNVMLGVFNIVKYKDGYLCYRIYVDNHNNVTVSDTGYPVSNIGNIRGNIDCDMNYIINVNILNLL